MGLARGTFTAPQVVNNTPCTVHVSRDYSVSLPDPHASLCLPAPTFILTLACGTNQVYTMCQRL